MVVCFDFRKVKSSLDFSGITYVLLTDEKKAVVTFCTTGLFCKHQFSPPRLQVRRRAPSTCLAAPRT